MTQLPAQSPAQSPAPAAAQAAQPHPFVKLGLDVGPLLIFFLTFRYGETLLGVPAIHGLLVPITGAAALAGKGGPLFVATAVFMAATLAALALSWGLTRHLPRMALVTAVVVAVFGGLTLWLQDATFIKMKPTVINLVFAAVLGAGLVRRRSYLKDLMGESMPLDDAGWRIFTRRWALFFLAMAVLNELVWRSQSTAIWVDFKTFGYLPMTLVFMAFQWPLLKRHALEQG